MARRQVQRRLVLAVLSGVLSALAGCGDGGDGEQSVFRMRPGDCFDDPRPGTQLSQIDVTPCDEPHDNEVFATVAHPAEAEAAFPGHDALVAHAEHACPAPFAEYVGLEYDKSRYSLFPIVPSGDTWAEGDRQIICALYDDEAGKMTASARGSAR